jgi:hypothetical protein
MKKMSRDKKMSLDKICQSVDDSYIRENYSIH